MADPSELEPIGDAFPERPPAHPQHGKASVHDAGVLLVRHLFTPQPREIDGIEYAVEYRMAQGDAGGDVIDVYVFDNSSVAFSASDISDKGAHAAVHAALVKFALRAYSSQGANPETTLFSLNKLYIENAVHEGRPSYATSFFGIVDVDRRVLGYASAGHDTVFLMHPGEHAVPLPVTAPMLGVFDSQGHLFRQRYVEVRSGTMLLAATDGVTDARHGDVEFFGMDRLRDRIEALRDAPAAHVARAIVDEAGAFWGADRVRDDMAVLAVRFR